jgi:hypothetical protein
VQKGKDFDPDAAPQTLKLVAAAAEEAQQWASDINAASQSLADDAMSIGFQQGNATLLARAVKLLVIEGGTPGQAAPSGVSLSARAIFLPSSDFFLVSGSSS